LAHESTVDVKKQEIGGVLWVKWQPNN
jgi:hypothetical protein